MVSNDATRNARLRDVDAPQAPQGHALSHGGNGYPVAANIQSPSDAELIDILQRALRGDPYPVSGRRPASGPAREAPPLADRIRDILRSDPPVGKGRAVATPMPSSLVPRPEPLPERPRPASIPLPDVTQAASSSQVLDRQQSQPEPALAPDIAQAERQPLLGRRGFGLKSIAFVAAAAIAGALMPALLEGPPQYAAEARLQLQGQALSQPGLLDATVKRIGSPHLLSQVVARLNLDRDPEFTGGRAGPFGIAMELVSGSGGASDAPSRAQAALHDAVTVSPNQGGGLLRLSVVTGDAAKSARIANMLADAAVYDAVIAQDAGLPGQATALDAGRKAYDQATAALAAFSAKSGADKIKAAIDLQQQQKQLERQAADADKAVVDARIRLTAAKAAKLGDVLDGSLSPDLRSSPALESLRDRYAAAKTSLSQLSVQLGPRHPRLLAQQAVVDGLRTDIQTELQRLVAASDADLKAALSDQKAVADRRAALGAKTVGVDMARLTGLQDAAEAARTRYEALLQGGGAAKPSAATVPLTLVAPAVAPTAPLDDDLAGSRAAGFLMGLGIALCLVFLRTWIADALLDGGEGAAFPQPETHRSEPPMEPGRIPLALPPQKFDAAIPVANDRQATAADFSPEDQAGGEDLAALQRRMAALRAKVETYAAQRHGSGR